jgi:molybdopterin converting factor subunit 1
MRVRILFFASLRERAKMSETVEEVPDQTTVGDLWSRLCAKHESIVPMTASVSFAVNREYADRDAVLRDGDEVALIPPVSGGS